MKHRWQWAMSSFSLCVMVLGCSSPLQTRGLKVGTLLPISGDLSQYGPSMQNAARLLAQEVNACGGVLGQSLTLVSEDDQTDAAIGAAAMTKLTEVDRVAGVVGAASSAVSSAAVNIAVRNQVVQISPASTSPIFTARARQGDFQGFWFRTAPPDTFQAKALAQLARRRGYQSVALLTINNDYGNGLTEAFISAFQTLGGTVTNAASPTRYDPKSPTFDSEVSQAFSGSPDAVLLIAYPETGSLILKTAYQLGLLEKQTAILATDGMKDLQIAPLVGKNAQGQYLVAGMVGTAPSAGGPGLQAFRDRFSTAYGKPPSIFDPNTWDATALLVLATEAAKTTTGKEVRDHVRQVANPPGTAVTDICQGLALIRKGQDIDYQGASGTVDLNAQGDVTGSYDVWTIDAQGQLRAIDTLVVQD